MKVVQGINAALKGIVELYGDSTDRNGKPKVMHPLEVADYFNNQGALFIVALLHDVVEDFGERGQALVNLIGAEEPVALLTRNPDETYEQYIERLIKGNNQPALLVKIADMRVNIKRCEQFGDSGKLKDRYEKYSKVLLKALLKQAVEGMFEDKPDSEEDPDMTITPGDPLQHAAPQTRQ